MLKHIRFSIFVFAEKVFKMLDIYNVTFVEWKLYLEDMHYWSAATEAAGTLDYAGKRLVGHQAGALITTYSRNQTMT